MRRLCPLAIGLVFSLTLLVPGAPARAEEAMPAALAALLRATGLDQLGSKSRIAFTFHVRAGENEASRSWEWNLEDGTVREEGQEVGKSPKFINDSYWLLFPAMLRWDLGKVEIGEREDVPAPISGRPMTELVVTYVDGAGSTPNDVYKLYLGDDSLVAEWAYHKAGAAAPTRLTTWEGYETVGGLHLSLDRRGEGFRVWFTGVSVE